VRDNSEWVIWVNLVGAFVSACLSFYVALWVSSWRFGIILRISLIFSGTLAWAYVASYFWLLGHPESVVAWSNTMRYVGMFAWWIGPWTALPLALRYQVTKMATRMKEEADKLISEYSLETEESHGDYHGFDSRPDS
jgi:hypothetical protein